MMTERGLTLLALATSILSMLLSMIALWPQWRDRLAVIRDVILWMALAMVAAGLFHIGWKRSFDERVEADRISSDLVSRGSAHDATARTWNDPARPRWPP